MRSLSALDIVQVWEWGQGKHLLEKALLMLAPAFPRMSRDELAMFSIGERNTYLFNLREQTLGPKLDAFTKCPQCSDSLEFSINMREIRRANPNGWKKKEYTLMMDGIEIRFRLLNSLDLAFIARYGDPAAARQFLIRRCILESRLNGKEIPAGELPENVVSNLATSMTDNDPQAEIQFNLTCPSCNHNWMILFDIASFFWTELSSMAKRLLHDVHILARTYGWREKDILSMNANRRKIYLDMVG